jgi:hypothetical protein
MSKRASQFERRERDFYPTPRDAVLPLLPHLAPGTRYLEPCAGDGALAVILDDAGHQCLGAYDVEQRERIAGFYQLVVHHDARSYRYPGASSVDCFITNPPWSREVLHPIIENLSRQLPTWLLFDADWMHTRQAAPYLPLLRKIVSVGRVKWIPDSPFTGKDNCAWYLFDANSEAPAVFVGRQAA